MALKGRWAAATALRVCGRTSLSFKAREASASCTCIAQTFGCVHTHCAITDFKLHLSTSSSTMVNLNSDGLAETARPESVVVVPARPTRAENLSQNQFGASAVHQ